jgi:hypothetical protein
MSRPTTMTTSEKAQGILRPAPPLDTLQQLFVSVVPGIGSLDDPSRPGFRRGGLASLGDRADHATAFQKLSGDVGVVSAIEVDTHPLRQPSDGVQSVAQERRVETVCGGRDDSESDALGVHGRRALDASFSAIHRALACLLTAARSFGDAAIDGHLGELKTDDPIVGFEHNLAQFVRPGQPRVGRLHTVEVHPPLRFFGQPHRQGDGRGPQLNPTADKRTRPYAGADSSVYVSPANEEKKGEPTSGLEPLTSSHYE